MTERSGGVVTPIIGDIKAAIVRYSSINYNRSFVGYDPRKGEDFVDNLNYAGPRTLKADYGSTRDRQGNYGNNFTKDMYGKIFMIPHYINAGNLTARQNHSVKFINTSLTTETINGMTSSGVLEGVKIDEPTYPVRMKPLTEYYIDLSIFMEGPPSIDATFTFSFSQPLTQSVKVEGSRVIAFTFEPDWKTPVKEKLTYWTQVIETYSGKEQRISLRRYPRWELSYDILNEKQTVNVFDSYMVQWSGRQFLLPMWQEKVRLARAASPGATTVFVDDNSPFDVGELAILWSAPDKSETFEVNAVSGNNVSFLTPVSREFNTSAFLMPAKFGRVKTPLAADFITGTVFSFGATIEPKQALYDLVPTPYPETYNGYQVVPFKHDFNDPMRHEYERRFEEYDNGLGQYDYKDRHGKVHERFSKNRILLYGRQEVKDFKNWLASVKGRAVPFYISMEEDQLTPSRQITGGQSNVFLSNYYYGLLAAYEESRRIWLIKTKAGQRWTAAVTAYQLLESREVQVTLDFVFPGNMDIDDIESISFLRLVRLDSDEIVINHILDGVSEVDLTFKSILI